MSQSRYSWTEPALCHYDHDLSRAWFVHFRFTDSLTGKRLAFQYRGQINRGKDVEERLKSASGLSTFWKKALEKGWNPFLDDDVKKLPIHYTITEGLQEILRIYLPGLKKKKSRETYAYVVRLFTQWITDNRLESLPLSKLTKPDATRYMDWLITGKGLAGRTHNDHLIVLATLFNAMVDREWIGKNPFHKIPRKKTTTGRNVAYTEREKEQLATLLKGRDERLYYFTQIMYYTYIRRTELTGLTVGDFDLVNKTIVIPGHVSKNGVQESVVIPVGLERTLKEMRLEYYPSSFYVFGRHMLTSDEPYVNACHITTRHNKFCRQLQLHPSKTLYSWKHTGVCAAYYATGKDLYALMRQLRHRSLETTQIYLKSLGLVQNDVFRNAMVA